MGNKGLSRLISTGDSVETKYFSPYEIPLLSLDRKEETLAKYEGKNILFVMVTPKSPFFNAQIQDLKQAQTVLEKSGVQVVGLASNSFNTKGATFDDLKKIETPFPIFPWVEANGDQSHPLMKYLKRHSSLYDAHFGGSNPNVGLYNNKLQKGQRLTQDSAKFFFEAKTGKTSYFANDVSVGRILQQQGLAA